MGRRAGGRAGWEGRVGRVGGKAGRVGLAGGVCLWC